MAAGEQIRVAALVLAAGSSQRMGLENKLLARIRGKSMVSRVVSSLSGSEIEIDHIAVVTGYQCEQLEAELAGMPVAFVHNDQYRQGMASSLRRGITALPAMVDVAMVVLADMPFLQDRELNLLLEACRAGNAKDIIVPVHRGGRGNPVLWPRYYWPEICELQGDQGAKSLVKKYSVHVVEVVVDKTGCFVDIDTPELLAEYNRGMEHDC